MKPILLLQFRTDQSLQHERQCYYQHSGLNKDEIEIINLLDQNPQIPQPDDINKYRGVIIGASGQINVTDWSDEVSSIIFKLKPFIKELIDKDFPTLAVCFGFQLTAKLFGGEVIRDLQMGEGGSFEVTLNQNGKECPIFKNIPSSFYVNQGHKDSVVKLPKGATLLAYSKACPTQAYQIGKNFFGVQFHPELDHEGITFRLTLYPEYRKGRTMEEVASEFKDIPHATKIIHNFIDIINS